MKSDAPPLGPDEARLLLEPLARAAKVVLAVSGGPDSIALMHLVAGWRDGRHVPPIAVASVDHALRDGSGAVADAVARVAESLGFAARVLAWTGPKPSTGLQTAARRARYDLIGAWATDIGATHLATAHTLDDQAETILFRLARGSGLKGLAGMRRISRRGELTHLRPLLGVPKKRLLATCEANGWAWCDDPANADPRFARARWRALAPLLAAEGLDAARLAMLARRFAEADAALDEMADRTAREARLGSDPRQRWFSVARLRQEPPAILARVLAASLDGLARPGPPRLSRLERAVAGLTRAWAEEQVAKRTLHGAVLDSGPDGVLRIAVAPPRRP